jgi:hypothetical protein
MKLVDIQQLSGELGPSVRALRTWVHARKIPFIKVGHRTMLFDPQKVRAALQKFEIQPPATK